MVDSRGGILRNRWLLALAGAIALAATFLVLHGVGRDSGLGHEPPALSGDSSQPNEPTSQPAPAPAEHRPVVSSDAQQVAARRVRGAGLFGTVTDEASRPLAGVDVRALDAQTLKVLGSTVTNPSGAFSLEGLPLGDIQLNVSQSEYRPERRLVSLSTDGERHDATVALANGHQITGRVVSRDGMPVAGARVGSSDDRGPGATTDAEGRFRLTGLGTQAVNVFVVAAGFAPIHARNVAPDKMGLELVAELPASVSGQVTEPPGVDHVMVSVCHFDDTFQRELCPARAVVRAPNERYELKGLAPGKYDLVAQAQGYPEQRSPVELAAGQVVQGPALGDW